MNIITQNPFRVLGLTSNATERELQKQIGIIKRYAEVGKTKSFDYDFEFIGDFYRNTDKIQEASNKIEQAHKKLLYSLFWFVKNTPFDEIAFNNLKENDTEKAIEIWNKTLKEEITAKNYSSYLNLSTLYIALSTIAEQIDLQKLQAGISLKGNLIHSESLKDFSKLVTGNGISNDPNEISKKFVDEVVELLKPSLNKRNGISTNDLISLFNTFPASIKKYISAKFTEIPISTIENRIEKTTQKRKNNPRNAEEYGEELYKSTKSDITSLKKILGSSNVQFQMISNKLANEILQCAIDYFNNHIDTNNEFDPSVNALRIAQFTNDIDTSGQIKTRIDENTKNLKDWADTSEERIRTNRLNKYCWYCDKNLAEENYQYETEMYRETSRSGFIQKKVSYQKCTIKINRCSNCYKIHNKGGKTILWLLITLYIISFMLFYSYAIAPEDDWGMVILFIFLGWIPAAIINWIISSIVSAINANKFNIKKDSDIKEHPTIRQMFKENWRFTEPTA